MNLHPYSTSQGVCVCRRESVAAWQATAGLCKNSPINQQQIGGFRLLCALSDLEFLHIKANKEDGVSEEQASVSSATLKLESLSSGLH